MQTSGSKHRNKQVNTDLRASNLPELHGGANPVSSRPVLKASDDPCRPWSNPAAEMAAVLVAGLSKGDVKAYV